MMELRRAHETGRRPPQPGDVLQDPFASGTPTALVYKVERPASNFVSASAAAGIAWLEWTLGGRVWCAKRKCSTMRGLVLLAVGADVVGSPRDQHRRGLRSVSVGDVLRDRARETEAVVVAVQTGCVRMNWLDSGRSSQRSTSSLHMLDLVRWGTNLP